MRPSSARGWILHRSGWLPPIVLWVAVPASAEPPPQLGSELDPWTLTVELRIGVPSDPVELTEVGRLEVDPEGRVYVSQPRDARVLRFDTDGTPLPALGRRGDGPEEFRLPTNLGWKQDTLWVLDSAARRVTFFHDGRVTRTLRVPEAPPELEVGSAFPVGFPEEEVLLVARSLGEPGVGTAPSSGVLFRTDDQARRFHELASIHIRERPRLETPGGSTVMLAHQPFDDSTLLQAAPDGSAVVLVERPAPERPEEAVLLVTKLRAEGDTVYRRPVRTRAVRVTERAVEAAISLPEGPLVDRYPSPAQALRALREAVFVPVFHPPVTDLAVGRDGSVWLRREDTGDPSVPWTVLDPRGELLAEVEAPAALRIFQVDGSVVWGVETDELGVPTVVKLRITREET